MKCIEAQQMVKPYLENKLSDRELEAFLDHVQYCADCYDELEIYFSIYEALGDNQKDGDRDEYDFQEKLEQDIESKWRYIGRRKLYHTLLVGAFGLTCLVLLLTLFTGFEAWREGGFTGTTAYRVFYGEPETESETESEVKSESEAESGSKAASGSKGALES